MWPVRCFGGGGGAYKSRGWWLQSQYKAKTCRSKGMHLKFAIHKESVKFFLCIFRALTCPNLTVFVNCTFRISESPVLLKSGRYIFFKLKFLKFFFSLFVFHFYFLSFLKFILNKNFKISWIWNSNSTKDSKTRFQFQQQIFQQYIPREWKKKN